MPLIAMLLFIFAGAAAQADAPTTEKLLIEELQRPSPAAQSPIAPDPARVELVRERDATGGLKKLLVQTLESGSGAKILTLTTYANHGKLITTSVWRNDVPERHSVVFNGVEKTTFHVYLKLDPTSAAAAPIEAKYRPHHNTGIFLETEISEDTPTGRKITVYRRDSGGKQKIVSRSFKPWETNI